MKRQAAKKCSILGSFLFLIRFIFVFSQFFNSTPGSPWLSGGCSPPVCRDLYHSFLLVTGWAQLGQGWKSPSSKTLWKLLLTDGTSVKPCQTVWYWKHCNGFLHRLSHGLWLRPPELSPKPFKPHSPWHDGANGQGRLQRAGKEFPQCTQPLIPVVPHEAVQEVWKGKVHLNQKKKCDYRIWSWLAEHVPFNVRFPFDFARNPFLLMARTR